ncbi:CotH kinase family protein [Spirosoma flavum]|uniref:CotH kinase family protein n=1 Tax=Spirosoma flavum TaxID=2048557 RepID=A0ABW6AFU9_9BACT
MLLITCNLRKAILLIVTIFVELLTARAQLVFEAGQYHVDEKLHLIICNRIPATIESGTSSVFFDKSYVFSSPINTIQVGLPYSVSFNEDTYKLYFTRLPIVTLNEKDSIQQDIYASGLLNIDDTTGAVYKSSIGIKIRGAYSSTFPKKSYHLQLWTDSTGNTTQDESIFGMRSDKTWLLLAMYNEKLRLNNKLSHDLWLKIHKLYYADLESDAHSTIRSRYVEVILNGDYQGVYLFTEDMDRKQLKLKKQTNADNGGELYKGDSWDIGTLFTGVPTLPSVSTELWGGWELSYPDTTNWKNLYDFTNFAVTSSDSTFKQKISTKIRQDNFADYFIFLNLLRAEDNTGKNLFLARDNVNEPYFIAPWDLDGTWGYYWDGSQKNTTNDVLSNSLFNRLLTTQSFKNQLTTRWFSLRKTTLSIDSLYGSINANYEFLSKNGVYERENMKWAGDLLSYGNDEHAYIQNWVSERVNWLDTYFKSINNEPTVYAFDATIAGTSVLLEWSANCSDIYSFDIERSTDSLNWNLLNTYPIISNDSTTCQYTFTDINPSVGKAYYRLKVADKESAISYSSVQQVKIDLTALKSNAVQVFPNPVSTTLQVLGSVEKINVYSALGMAIYESDSLTPNTVDVKKFPTGLYLVRVTQKNGVINTYKVLVNR